MKQVLLSIFSILSLAAASQTADLPVSANPTTVCAGSGSTVTTTGSQVGVNYSLRNSSNIVIAGPIAGTGNDLNFSTGPISSTETFNVYAEPVPITQFSIGVNGINYGINLTNHNRGTGSSGLSVGAWIRTSSTLGGLQYIASKYTGNVGFLFYMDGNGKINMDGRKYNSAYVASGPSTQAVNDGQWHYVVGTANGATFKVYIDGVLQSSNTSGTPGHMSLTNTADLVLGIQNAGTFVFDGEMDEFCMWNTDLTDADVANNYTACLSGNEPNLTGLFKFDGGLNALIDDAVLGINGSLNSNAAYIAQGPTACQLGSPLQMSQTATVNVVTIADESLSGNSTFCPGGSETILTGGSTSGANYFLIDDNGTITDGPVAGTGSAISLNTGNMSSTTTFKVFASLNSTPPSNSALEFDGTNDHLNLTNNGRNISSEISVSCWVKTTASASNKFVVSKYNGASGFYMLINTSGKISFDGKGTGGGGYQSGSSTTSVDDGQWHYVVGTGKLGGSFKIYVDGVLEGTSPPNSTGATLANTTNLLVAAYTTNYANITIDDVAIWNTELSQSEIQTNMTTCLDGSETSLQGLYKLNEASGSTTEDLSPNLISGTLGNMDPATDWVTGSSASCFSSSGCGLFMSQESTFTVDNAAPVADLANLPDVNGQCEVTSLTAPSATDYCSGAITGTHNASFPITSNTTVMWTYDDGDGNTSTQAQNVVLNDNIAPAADIASLSTVSDPCEITSLTAPTATDNCAGAITGTHNASFPITSSTSVTWTYDDGNGNTSTQSQSIVINDNVAPTADVTNLPNITAQCEVTSLTAPTATDNCGAVITGTHNATLPISSNTTITWTYDDGNGNTSTQAQDVVLNDISAPVADIASLSNLTAQCEITALTAPTATDNCEGAITGTHNATLPISSNTTITWTYDDGNGNTASQTQNVVINDNTAPVADVGSLGNVTAQCEITSLTPPSATDNCEGSITGTHNATFPITSNTTITWTYDDGNGNTSTQTQDLVLNDVTAPIADIGSLPNLTAQCEVTSLTAPTATDNCVGSVIATHNATLPISSNTTITWTFDDGNGNTSSQSQNVVINDNTAPVADLASLPALTDECSITSLTAPTATDNCAGNIMATHNASLPITASTTITWTYTDPSGNTSTQSQTVTIDDVTAPQPDLATLPNVTAQCSVTSLNNPGATDNCSAVLISNNASLPITANTTITWTYTDVDGNQSTQTQNVVINDDTNPVADLTSLTDVTAQCEITSLNPPTATDNCDGPITGTHNATLPITASTTVVWTYTDGSGNMATQNQNVVIDDNTPPVADAATLSDLTAQCEITSLTAPTATDNCASTVVVTNDATLPITSSGVITWTYDDGNGNTSTQAQNVTISDNTAPVLDAATLSDVTSECEVTSLTPPTATDNCFGVIDGTPDVSFPIASSTTITWTFVDGNSNSTTQTQEVIIADITAPVPDVQSLSDITASCEVSSLTAPTATDNCVGTVTATHNATLPITNTTTITWTYDDGSGNTATQDQVITIEPVDASIATSGFTITASEGNADGYQWVDCNNGNAAIAGETGQSFTATANGSYAVEVTIGSCTETSPCEVFTTIGLDEKSTQAVTIYPNPAVDMLHIVSENSVDKVIVIDIKGSQVQMETTADFSVESLTTGTYFLEIYTNVGITRAKFVKR